MRFIRESGLYPSCDRGHVNLYQPFLERALSLAKAGGRVGLILPWGLATDDGAIGLRGRLLDTCSLDTIVGLDNSAALFPIHRGTRFLVAVASPRMPPRDIAMRCGIRTSEELDALPDVTVDPRQAFPIRLTRERIETLTGRSRRIPDVRRVGELDMFERIARTFRPLGDSAGWHARFLQEPGLLRL